MTRHYLDHASTSPLRPEAATAMAAMLTGVVEDPGRIHHEGMVARHAVETAREQVAAHSGSACASEVLEPSPVLEAIGVDAHRSLRLSVGWNTTDADLDASLDVVPGILGDLRALR